jgi:hypothetical protein
MSRIYEKQSNLEEPEPITLSPFTRGRLCNFEVKTISSKSSTKEGVPNLQGGDDYGKKS